jgi:tetratricopeptide (TPR) repeat protein
MMVELAVEAFRSKNYNLAVEIYERLIKENGPKREYYLGLGNSLAKLTQLQEAFESYSNAFRLGQIKPEDLGHLVNGLVEMMRGKDEVEDQSGKKTKKTDIFSCSLCLSVWIDPVTMNCGHTFCRRCMEKEEAVNRRKVCKECGVVIYTKLSSLKSNVLLCATVEKWFPEELKAAKLRTEGNDWIARNNFKEAITAYSKAKGYAPHDHILLSNRSYAHACLKNYKEALDDAQVTINMCPDWPKGHYRKGSALLGLDRHEDAALAYLHCLGLDPELSTARKALEKVTCHSNVNCMNCLICTIKLFDI